MSRARTLLTTAAIVTSLLGLPAAAKAVCIPDNFPGNWLQQQENAGGHTIARHVGKTDLQLTTRLQNQGLNAVGSYPSAGPPYPAAAAQATIIAGVSSNRNVINQWAANANAGATTAYNYVTAPPATIGRVATWDNGNPPAPVVNNTCTFRVVVRATGGGNCYVLTSFPHASRRSCLSVTNTDALYGYLAGQFADADLAGQTDEQAAIDGLTTKTRAAYEEVLRQGRNLLAAPSLDRAKLADYANRRFADDDEARRWLGRMMAVLETALKQS